MKSYVIIGLGRFGTALALKLQELGNEVMVIDENAEQVQKLSNRVTYAVVGDARDEEVLTSWACAMWTAPWWPWAATWPPAFSSP